MAGDEFTSTSQTLSALSTMKSNPNTFMPESLIHFHELARRVETSP